MGGVERDLTFLESESIQAPQPAGCRNKCASELGRACDGRAESGCGVGGEINPGIKIMDTNMLNGEAWWFTWVLLPLLILVARVADQSIGTLRVVFVSKGFKYLAPAVGFVESIIWLMAVSQILQHADNVACYIAYGLGFSIGSYIGITIEEKISIGRVIVRVVANHQTTELIAAMRERHFGLTEVDGQGGNGPVKLLFSVIERKHIGDLVSLINKWNPNAFYSIEEVKVAREGIFRPASSPLAMLGFGLRKSK